MKPRITLITLGVDDLERSLAFYRDGLGWPSQGIIGTEFEHGAVAFFDLDGGLKLALCGRANISYDTGLPLAPGARWEVRDYIGNGKEAGRHTKALSPTVRQRTLRPATHSKGERTW